MKTPHSGLSTRVWVKALAGICVANAVLLAGVDAACVDLVSGGDKGVGISAFDDAGLSGIIGNGGSGDYGCTSDQLNGIKVITDISCVYNPVVGCFKDICRFCKTRDTIASSNFLQCPETAAPATSTPQPTAAPMTSAPAPVSAPPAPIPAPPVPSVPGTAFPVIPASTSPPYTGKLCTVVVSTGDSQVGIKAITDPGCQTEAKVGCFESVCRYCKTKSTPQSNHLLDCPIDAIPSGPVAPTPAPATVPTFTPPASGTPAPTSAPVSSPSPAAPPPTATVALSGQIIPQACKRTVSPGDALQGIAVITDSSCLGEPGVGCVDSFCRFCKTKDTAASGHLLPCCDFPTVPTSVKTPGPNLCSSAVQPSQALSGIWTNVVCSQWYRGQCLKSACPLCKFFDTSASSSLAACVAPTTAPAVPAPMPGAPAANLCSDAMLSEEQPSFGIWAMWDQTCASSQSDCVSKCRYCKYGESAQSAALKGCSSITPLPPPPVFVPPPPGSVRPPTPSANECSGSMTTQDAYNGVWRNAQCFETNAAGACVSVVCSPCSFFDTAASFKFPDCVNGITPYWSSSPAVNLQLALSSGSSSANAAAGALSPLEIAVAVAAVVGIATLFVVAVIATPSILAIVSSDEPDEPPQPRSVRPRKVKAPRTPLTA
ncbi:hypothetical protein PybrP1_005453 [[Pythium] brassicae (nom. inval.)]|nr:hypothetical protein PybrP1_005453 [[Pythium] brassicae (nom. inval.)]